MEGEARPPISPDKGPTGGESSTRRGWEVTTAEMAGHWGGGLQEESGVSQGSRGCADHTETEKLRRSGRKESPALGGQADYS